MIFGRYFFKYYIKYGIFFLIGIGILIFIDYIQVDIPVLIGHIVDILNQAGPRDTASINNFLWEIVRIASVIAIGRCLWRFCIFSTSRQIEYEIRNVMFAHACCLDSEFYHNNKVGGLMTYFINDLAAVRESFGPGILTLIDGIFLSTFTVIKMFSLNSTLSYVVLALLVGLLTVVILQSLIMKRKFKLRQDSFEKLSDFVNESFSGIQVIKAYLKETSELAFFNQKSQDFRDKHLSFVRVAVRVEIFVSIITNVIALVILALGSFFIIQMIAVGGRVFSGGELTAYITLFFELLWPLTAITRFLNINSQGQASAKR
ncbi:MAG: hypothetical protein LBV55_01005, partial [Acholeplasmatales bacterium]|nr:hypothetical protein [Acholeplasmatales bacterium]